MASAQARFVQKKPTGTAFASCVARAAVRLSAAYPRRERGPDKIDLLQVSPHAEASPDEAQRFRSGFLRVNSLPNRCWRTSSSQPRAQKHGTYSQQTFATTTQTTNKLGSELGRCLVNLGEGGPAPFSMEWNKSKNTGITSVDRSTKATLSTYNPWIQVSRLQKIYHFQHQKLRCTTHALPNPLLHVQKGRDLMLVL